jgi:hypothetical protein
MVVIDVAVDVRVHDPVEVPVLVRVRVVGVMLVVVALLHGRKFGSRGREHFAVRGKAEEEEDRSMPTTRKKATTKKTSRKKTSRKKTTRKYSPATSETVHEELHEMKQGKLRSGRSGKKVTDRKQAIAIGLSEARRSGKKVPPNPNETAREKS